jgi:hypothetical protein
VPDFREPGKDAEQCRPRRVGVGGPPLSDDSLRLIDLHASPQEAEPVGLAREQEVHAVRTRAVPGAGRPGEGDQPVPLEAGKRDLGVFGELAQQVSGVDQQTIVC